MPSSTSSSSSPDRGRDVERRHWLVLGLVVAAVVLANLVAGWGLGHVAELRFERSRMAVALDRAVSGAADRELLVVIGTSQVRRAVDPELLDESLAEDAAQAVYSYNLGIDGFHFGGLPYALRRGLPEARPRAVVLGLGHIQHDQYAGARYIDYLIEDASVREAFRETGHGARHTRLIHTATWFPLVVCGPWLRETWNDGNRRERHGGSAGRSQRHRGFGPVTHRKTEYAGDLRVPSESDYWDSALPDSPHEVTIEAIRLAAEICREAGVPLIVVKMPVNREIAPHIRFLRHWEDRLERDTLPRIRALGVPVLEPPERFFEAELYSDHVHLHASAAPDFTRWLADALAEELPTDDR